MTDFDVFSAPGMLLASGANICIDSEHHLHIEKGRRGTTFKYTPLQYQLLATACAKVQHPAHRGTIRLEQENRIHFLALKKGRYVSEFFLTVKAYGADFTTVLSKSEMRLLQEKAHSLALSHSTNNQQGAV